MPNYANVNAYYQINWANVPAADLTAVLAEAVLKFGCDGEDYRDDTACGEILHSLLVARGSLGECNGCSRPLPIGVDYCGEDGEECRDDE